MKENKILDTLEKYNKFFWLYLLYLSTHKITHASKQRISNRRNQHDIKNKL
jgi:hypothetical protein